MRIGTPLFVDAAVAVVLAAVGAIGTAFAVSSTRAEVPIDGFGFALFLVAALALGARRHWPLPVFVVVAVCTSGYLVLGFAYGPILVAFMVSVYTAARRVRWARALPFAVAGLGLLLIHLVTPGTKLGLLGAAPVAAWVVVPFCVGVVFRLRHDASVRARAETIRRIADDERFRVAQEVHDIVGHGLAAIKMQADIALHVLAKKPDQAEVALAAISRTSSQALDELRATLAVVRGGTELAPNPGLARLDELRQRMAQAGVTVTVRTRGAAVLPAEVDLTGYRIVQESLTNVLRHSGAGQATVDIAYEQDQVRIEITNPTVAVPNTVEGSGIRGMRDRVHGLGGQFCAGVTDQRFEVRARLPIGARS
ncbi:sensor histidine kinase [Nocardia altamirensis]|uniref:sensor histidine kinase n=1 Tax=Nocardia altamirensis TaxID=472158 RepID=UPI0008408B30